ncbi:MAG: CHAT domain-containing protein [Chthoniobacterales bacterium]
MCRSARRITSFSSLALWLALAVLPIAAEPSAELPQEFLKHLEAAKTPAQQDEIIRAARLPLSGQPFRRALLRRAYQLTIDGDYARAQAFDDLVSRLAQAAGAGEDAAGAQVQNAYLFREEGDIAGALVAVGKALAYYEAHPGNKRGLISAYETEGLCRMSQSDFARALEGYHRALSLSEEIKSPAGIIAALNSIGEVYRTQGEPERALQFYTKARKAVGDDHAWNMAFIFNNIGMCYDAMGDLDRAIENIEQARAVAENVHARPRVETSLAVLGDLELKRGQLDPARDSYAQSLQLAQELHDAAGAARATLGRAQVALARGDAAAALEQAREAAALSRQTGKIDQVAPALTLCGQSLQALDRDEEAKKAFEGAIAAVEEMRGRVAGGDIEREALFAQRIAPYRELVALLVRQNRPEEALLIAEKASARVLLDATDGDRTEWPSILTADERSRFQEMNLKAAEANHALTRLQAAAKPDEAATARAETALREARSAQDDFATLIQSSHPELRRMMPPAVLNTLSELEPTLRGGKTTLLRFLVGEKESFLFVVTLPNDSRSPALQVIPLGQGRAALTRLTKDYRSKLANRSLVWEKSSRQLYDLLLRPAAAQLTGADSIVIVPDGPLWELPFQSLERAVEDPLLVDYSVRYAPSLTLLARAQKVVPTSPEHQLLAFINPALGSSPEVREPVLPDHEWEPLPGMEKQAGELAKIYPAPAGEIFVGAEASEKTFKEKGSGAAMLHFATHGVLDDRAPLYSYLLLSQINIAPGEDGRLDVRELLQMKLHARLAVLCGCETARGEVTAGEGVVGLSWGFLVAGCPATIVSQWKVGSTSSTQLMVELYRELHNGVENAEALRRASLKLREDARYRHPFYWAPFVLVGANL